jgi:ABC-type multidrug transport system permease subunit
VRKIWILACNDLRRTFAERASLIWMLLLPVAMMWFFGQMGGSSGTPKIGLTVVDRDGGWIARRFVQQLATDRVELHEKSGAEALSENDVRVLTLPSGFTAKVLAGEQQKLVIEQRNNANPDFSRAADVNLLRAVTRTLALLVEMKIDGKLPPKLPEAAAAAEYDSLAARPRLVSLEVSTAGEGTPVPVGTAQSVPGILTMTVLMMTLIYGGAFLTFERQAGMLRRQVTLPITRAQLLLGKLFGRFFLASLQIVVLLAVGRLLFSVSLGKSPAGLALLLCAYAFCVSGMATFVGAVFRTPEQAAAIAWISSMVMAALGGCWWPSEVMPRWLWSTAHVFPTAWAMDAFHALISFGRGLPAVWLPAAVLAAFGAVFTALGARYLEH